MILGITGTIGAGKGAVVEYLRTKHQFVHLSARDFITNEITKRGLPINRDTMTEIANLLRQEHGSSFIVEELYRQADRDGRNVVIESIRTEGELTFLRKQKNFSLLAIDSEQKLRYQRVLERKSSTDNISFAKFRDDEAREAESDDPNKQNINFCIKNADFVIRNNGSFEDLHTEIEKILEHLSARTQ